MEMNASEPDDAPEDVPAWMKRSKSSVITKNMELLYRRHAQHKARASTHQKKTSRPFPQSLSKYHERLCDVTHRHQAAVGWEMHVRESLVSRRVRALHQHEETLPHTDEQSRRKSSMLRRVEAVTSAEPFFWRGKSSSKTARTSKIGRPGRFSRVSFWASSRRSAAVTAGGTIDVFSMGKGWELIERMLRLPAKKQQDPTPIDAATSGQEPMPSGKSRQAQLPAAAKGKKPKLQSLVRKRLTDAQAAGAALPTVSQESSAAVLPESNGSPARTSAVQLGIPVGRRSRLVSMLQFSLRPAAKRRSRRQDPQTLGMQASIADNTQVPHEPQLPSQHATQGRRTHFMLDGCSGFESQQRGVETSAAAPVPTATSMAPWQAPLLHALPPALVALFGTSAADINQAPPTEINAAASTKAIAALPVEDKDLSSVIQGPPEAAQHDLNTAGAYQATPCCNNVVAITSNMLREHGHNSSCSSLEPAVSEQAASENVHSACNGDDAGCIADTTQLAKAVDSSGQDASGIDTEDRYELDAAVSGESEPADGMRLHPIACRQQSSVGQHSSVMQQASCQSNRDPHQHPDGQLQRIGGAGHQGESNSYARDEGASTFACSSTVLSPSVLPAEAAVQVTQPMLQGHPLDLQVQDCNTDKQAQNLWTGLSGNSAAHQDAIRIEQQQSTASGLECAVSSSSRAASPSPASRCYKTKPQHHTLAVPLRPACSATSPALSPVPPSGSFPCTSAIPASCTRSRVNTTRSATPEPHTPKRATVLQQVMLPRIEMQFNACREPTMKPAATGVVTRRTVAGSGTGTGTGTGSSTGSDTGSPLLLQAGAHLTVSTISLGMGARSQKAASLAVDEAPASNPTPLSRTMGVTHQAQVIITPTSLSHTMGVTACNSSCTAARQEGSASAASVMLNGAPGHAAVVVTCQAPSLQPLTAPSDLRLQQSCTKNEAAGSVYDEDLALECNSAPVELAWDYIQGRSLAGKLAALPAAQAVLPPLQWGAVSTTKVKRQQSCKVDVHQCSVQSKLDVPKLAVSCTESQRAVLSKLNITPFSECDRTPRQGSSSGSTAAPSGKLVKQQSATTRAQTSRSHDALRHACTGLGASQVVSAQAVQHGSLQQLLDDTRSCPLTASPAKLLKTSFNTLTSLH